jgi:hypothetical protein
MYMTNRRFHRFVGIAMLAPLIAWTVTGAVFLLQPGYGAAYEMLALRTYPLTAPVALTVQSDWREIRYLKSVLGDHLLVRRDQTWEHLDPQTLATLALPEKAMQVALVADAISVNPLRYGEVLQVIDDKFLTSNGVEINLDWDSLSLRQYGNDTRWIDRLYRVHYLQWTGIKLLDKILGVFGLLLLILISYTGVRLILNSRTTS